VLLRETTEVEGLGRLWVLVILLIWVLVMLVLIEPLNGAVEQSTVLAGVMVTDRCLVMFAKPARERTVDNRG
jgi:hypothetical protein